MLKRVGHPVDEKGAAVAIKDATFPVPFAQGLEFNSPVHGNWNIVHTGMMMPEARQIYVCADNCMRGVVLTAAEMNAADRFSFVIVKEENLLNGNLEDITIEVVTDVLNKLEEKPKAVLLFTVCLHHFLGCDLERVYQELEERFPKITFIRCYMDPIMQKHGPTPDQKLRKAIYEPLPKRKADEKAVSFLGSDFVLEKNADLKRIVRAHQGIFRELPGCKSWEDYLALSEGKLFISSYPPSKYGAEALSERLKRPYLYLPGSFDYEEITAQLENFCQTMGYGKLEETISVEEEIAACEKELEKAHEVIGDTAVAIDYLYHPRPLGLAKILLTHGFRVIRIYLDSISPEEKAEFEWLKEHAPDLQLIATIQVKMRVLPRTSDEKILAIGQKAAWFTGSPYFVNMVQGGGLYGFDGIRRTAELMAEAFTEEKDTEDLVVRKGWGCESCI